MNHPFESLEFLYTPSSDVAADVEWFTKTLGAECVFAVDGMGARVALIRLTEEPPHILLADHLSGQRPVLVYQVAHLQEAIAALRERGFESETTFEIPHGVCSSFAGPGGHRIAILEVTRPQATQFFAGRFDF